MAFPLFATSSPAPRLTSSTLRDAQAGAYAAAGHALSTGRPSIFVARGTAESLAAASAALTAWADKLPVVFLCQCREKDFTLIRGVFTPVSRSVIEIRGRGKIPVSGLPRPCYRAFPAAVLVSPRASLVPVIESLEKGISGYPADPADQGAFTDLSASLKAAARRLEKAKRPALLLGRGGARDTADVLRLAGRANCPILLTAGATTMPAGQLEILKRSDALVVPSGNLAWVRILAAADLILALGAGLSEADWFGLLETRIHRAGIVRVDTDPDPAGDALCDQSVPMPVRRFAREILDLVPADMGPRRRAWIDRGRQWCRRWKDSLDREAERASRSDPLDPAYAAHEIVRRAPRGTTFVSEGGACGMWLMASLWMHPLVFPVQQATIGTSIPMALGAAVGMRSARDAHRPPVWCVLGDGAFFYHAAELAALSRHRVPAVLFVFNDSSWGAIRLGQTFACGGRYTGTDIPATDYAAVARACGCEALTAAGPRGLLEALERAAAARGPLLVDVKIRKDAVPFSGANFVLAEFDGVLKTSAPALAGGALLGALRRKVPAGVLRVMMSMMR